MLMEEAFRLLIRDQERGWISYLTIDSNPNLSSQSVFLSFFFTEWQQTVSLWLQTLFVIWRLLFGETEGRKWGRSPSQCSKRGGVQLGWLGGYKNIFLGNFVQPKVRPKFWVDLPNSRDCKPRSTRDNLLAHSFLLHFSLLSACLNSAFRIDKNPQTHLEVS